MGRGASYFCGRAHWIGLAFGCACAVPASLFVPGGPASAQTAAGTAIRNMAGIGYAIDGVPAEGSSNETLTIVAERLDVRLATSIVTASATDGMVRIPVTITNGGTGNEAFAITASGSGTAPDAVRILQDDVPLDGGLTPLIPPGGTIALVVVVPAGDTMPASDTIVIAARATTGSGDPGTVHDGRGDGGGDAIVGPTGARAEVSVPIADAAAEGVFEKSQSVAAPDGSAAPVRGAVVTYRLTARLAGAVRAARIDDPVPDGTRYVPGSLRIDEAVLSDAADGDAGECDGGRVSVRLGDVPAAGIRTIRFQVTIL